MLGGGAQAAKTVSYLAQERSAVVVDDKKFEIGHSGQLDRVMGQDEAALVEAEGIRLGLYKWHLWL